MQWSNPNLAFPNADQYAFLYEGAHLLMMSWERDDAKFLFLIKEHRDDGLVLDYPGETFTNQVLDLVENIFFISVQESDGEPRSYVLGSYFVVDGAAYGAFYERDNENPEVVLFRIEGEIPELKLENLSPEEHRKISAVFTEQHQDIIDIDAANQQV
jgi:hypothetical protein